MDRFFRCAENICKKQLIPLALIFAMLISATPLQVMAVEEKPAEQTVDRTLVKNGGFESGDLRDWTVLTSGWGVNEQGSPTGVVNARSYGECELPTNQSGSYHLSGLHNGIPETEGWTVRSSNFLLSGSGWISVKMGGQAAAVKVFLEDGTQVGYYRQNRFRDVNYPYLSQGGSWNDMATYVMDLSEYLGKEMYVVLCDEVIEGKSASALFDDVITYYDTAPDPTFRFDTVMDGHPELGSASEVQIPWVMGYLYCPIIQAFPSFCFFLKIRALPLVSSCFVLSVYAVLAGVRGENRGICGVRQEKRRGCYSPAAGLCPSESRALPFLYARCCASTRSRFA